MRAGRLIVLAMLAVGLMAAPASATPHFAVGQGRDPGVAIDAAGTAYIGWQVNTYADTGDAVQLCVLRARARACASLATIAFPGSGYNVGRVSVLLPAPGVVEVAVGRNLQNVYGYYLGTSVDGGARHAHAAPARARLRARGPTPLSPSAEGQTHLRYRREAE